MRPTLLVSLLVFGVALAEARAQEGPWGGRWPSHGRQLDADRELFSAEVTGEWKSTADEAKESALESARAKALGFLRHEEPTLTWVPPLEYVERHLLKATKGERVRWETRDFGPDVGTMFRAKASVSLTAAERGDLVQADRHQRMKDRELWLSKVLGTFMAVFLAVAGYIRLDEWSKTAGTRWLRVAAASCAAVAVGVGVWLLVVA